MPHPIEALSDAQLVAELLALAPPEALNTLRDDFTASAYRYRAALEDIPEGHPQARLLDVGARLYTAPLYVNTLGYGAVSLTSKWATSFTDEQLLKRMVNGHKVSIEHFDAEVEPFPYADAVFDVVVCTEVLEHLAVDPLHMLAEINRVCKPGGLLVVTTPNAASFDALLRLWAGKHPYSWAPYNGSSTDRHNREYTISELERVMVAAGFDVVRSRTIAPFPFDRKQRLLAAWLSLPDRLRGKAGLDMERMRKGSAVVARKAAPVRDRRPGWLYFDPLHGRH